MGDNYKLYNILEVNKNATEDEIKVAYKKKAMQYHPDKNKDPDSATKFKEISNAYSILGDKDKRNKYDHCGDNNYNEGGNDEMRSHRDIFEAFFRGHEGGFPDNIFGFGGGGRGGRQERRQSKADSIESVFNLKLDDVYEGVKKDLIAWYPKVKKGGIFSGHDYGWTEHIRQAVDEVLGKGNYADPWGCGCFIYEVV